MKNSVSDQSFYMESEGEDEEKAYNKCEDHETGNDSDSSNYFNDDDNYNQRQQSKHNSQWPQTYRYIFTCLYLCYCFLICCVVFYDDFNFGIQSIGSILVICKK